jgi:signal transduction histidine kinase
MADENLDNVMLRQEKQLRVLSRVTQNINKHLEIETILRTLVEAALELTCAKEGTAGLFIDGQMVFSEYFTQGQWIPVAYSFPPGYGVPGWVLENKKPYISNDTANDPVVVQEIREKLNFYNLADTPILNRHGELVGCFEIHNTEDHRPFDNSDVTLLEGLSASAAIAIENAQIIEDLKNTQAQLIGSKTYLQSLFEETPTPLWEEDFSAVKKYLDNLAEQGVDNLASHIRENPDIVVQCSRLAKIINVNKATTELFEAKNKDELLDNVEKVFTAESLDAFSEELICMVEGKQRVQALGINKTLGGKELEVMVNWSVLPGYEESWEKIIVSMVDVTREREIDKMKNEFISIAAHELRTPLTSLLGYTELLQTSDEKQLDPELREECFTNIYTQGMALERIIDDLLDVGKIESGRALLIEKSQVHLPEFLSKICNNHQRETSRHDIRIELSDDDICLWFDQARMTQVLDNLLSNAIKYSPCGGVITVTAKTTSNQATISVTDSGIGMTDHERQRIFDKFYRADTSNTAVRGLGLGMNIVRNIIEAHGGTISLESVKNQGTTITFIIPREEV